MRKRAGASGIAGHHTRPSHDLHRFGRGDDRGHRRSRIVTLSGDFSEIVWELGLGDNLVGVDPSGLRSSFHTIAERSSRDADDQHTADPPGKGPQHGYLAAAQRQPRRIR